MSLKHRLDAIEAARARRQRRMMAATAAEYGLSVDEFLEEAEAFFTLPLAEQLAQVDDIDAELRRQGMSMNNVADIKATLIREYRPI
jgi:hypothetical protein